MPIQELLIWSAAELPRPAGVLFDPPCKSRDEDIDMWKNCYDAHLSEMKAGNYIMVIVQTRNFRSWNQPKNQFSYNPAEDYIIASYSVDSSLGVKYDPGTVSSQWLIQQFLIYSPNEQQKKQTGLSKLFGKKPAPGTQVNFTANDKIIPIFRVSEQGCKLTTSGVLSFTAMNMKNGQSRADAFTTSSNNIVNGKKYGWLGGTFPKLRTNVLGSRPV